MKRQRHVYPTDEIAHLWAHQTQADARNARGNFYFEGDTIYSYGSHFPIARIVSHNGRRAVMLTSRGYSSTTAGHICDVKRAIPNGLPVFRVSRPTASKREHFDEFKASVKAERKSFDESGSRPQRVSRYKSLRNAVEAGNDFNEFFGYLTSYDLPANSAELDREAAEYDATLAARREAKHEKQHAKWLIDNAQRLADEARELPEKIERWRAGEYARLPYDHPTMLRIEGDEVVTSRGARFPVEHAIRAVPMIERAWRIVESLADGWAGQEQAIRLGHYSIDRIDADGTIHAGCHVIQRAEVERLIAELAVNA